MGDGPGVAVGNGMAVGDEFAVAAGVADGAGRAVGEAPAPHAATIRSRPTAAASVGGRRALPRLRSSNAARPGGHPITAEPSLDASAWPRHRPGAQPAARIGRSQGERAYRQAREIANLKSSIFAWSLLSGASVDASWQKNLR